MMQFEIRLPARIDVARRKARMKLLPKLARNCCLDAAAWSASHRQQSASHRLQGGWLAGSLQLNMRLLSCKYAFIVPAPILSWHRSDRAWPMTLIRIWLF